MMRSPSCLVAGLLATSLASCGGPSGEASRGAKSPTAAYERYVAGVKAGDGRRACSLLTAAEQQRTAGGGGSCEQSIAAHGRARIAPILDLYDTVIGVRTTATRGALTLTSRGVQRGTVSFEKAGGKWLISALRFGQTPPSQPAPGPGVKTPGPLLACLDAAGLNALRQSATEPRRPELVVNGSKSRFVFNPVVTLDLYPTAAEANSATRGKRLGQGLNPDQVKANVVVSFASSPPPTALKAKVDGCL